MTNKKILLLTDWIVKNNDWSFLRELLVLGHECETVGMEITRKYNSRLKKVVYLWTGYFLIGLKGFLKRKKFDVVIAYQGVAGLFYSFFKMIAFSRTPKLILMAFFFKKRKSRFYTQLRYYFTKMALLGVDKVICYSSKEADYYNRLFGSKNEKFQFVPFGVNVERLKEMNSKSAGEKKYLFSAGSSNRDYQTFFEAVEDLQATAVVFAKKFNVAGLQIPDNVEVEYDVYGDRYYEKLLGANLVVIPLDDPELSSGQMVLLESMALGKTVVVTDVWGVNDYVEDGKDAILVKHGDSHSMQERIKELLSNGKKIQQLGEQAKRKVFDAFTVRHMAERVSIVASQI